MSTNRLAGIIPAFTSNCIGDGMAYYTDYDNVVSERDELESELEELQTLIDLLEPHDRKIEIWDVPNCSEIENAGGDPDDTVGKALKIAKIRATELECDLDELESEMRALEGHLGII